MNKPLERLTKLTLSLEAAATSSDWNGFNALLAERKDEISKIPAGNYVGAEELLNLDARVQAMMADRMNNLRTRMQATAHAKRTVRAVQASQGQSGRLELAG